MNVALKVPLAGQGEGQKNILRQETQIQTIDNFIFIHKQQLEKSTTNEKNRWILGLHSIFLCG